MKKKKKETYTSGKDNVTTDTIGRVGLAVNGSFSKVQKGKLIQRLNFVFVDPRGVGVGGRGVYVSIVDMGMIWQMPTPTQEDREKFDTTVYAWAIFVTKIVNLDNSRHQLATKIIMVNDSYNFSYSIKDNGSHKRKQGNSAIPKVFPQLKDNFFCFRIQHVSL